ncbi:hypothetical protein [Enterobacter quasihormaechei]|uniref:hypothetical protein n=1 Tax=Enterobacter quasihormaechei TaxID=2529382 RepID=UPI002F41E335
MEDAVNFGVNSVWHHIRIALTVLWGYFSRLDRLDVFFEVMSIKSIFVLVFLAATLSLVLLLFIFFVISLFIPLVIPQDMNNLPGYEKIQNNLLTVLMIAGVLPVIFIYIFLLRSRCQSDC